jgi:transposase
MITQIVLTIALVYVFIRYIEFFFDVYGYRYQKKLRQRYPQPTPPPKKPKFSLIKK